MQRRGRKGGREAEREKGRGREIRPEHRETRVGLLFCLGQRDRLKQIQASGEGCVCVGREIVARRAVSTEHVTLISDLVIMLHSSIREKERTN